MSFSKNLSLFFNFKACTSPHWNNDSFCYIHNLSLTYPSVCRLESRYFGKKGVCWPCDQQSALGTKLFLFVNKRKLLCAMPCIYPHHKPLPTLRYGVAIFVEGGCLAACLPTLCFDVHLKNWNLHKMGGSHWIGMSWYIVVVRRPLSRNWALQTETCLRSLGLMYQTARVWLKSQIHYFHTLLRMFAEYSKLGLCEYVN